LASSGEEAAAEDNPFDSAPTVAETSRSAGTGAGIKRKTVIYTHRLCLKRKGNGGSSTLSRTFSQAESGGLLGVVMLVDHPYSMLKKHR